MSPDRADPARLVLSSATDQVAELVRQRVFAGELRPGQRIAIRDLAEALGVSRTPVREALHALATQGLVTIEPRVGVTVRDMDPSETDDTYLLRLSIEPIAVELAMTRAPSTQRHRVLVLTDRLHEQLAAREVAAFESILERIHRTVFELSASQVLVDAYDVITPRLRLSRGLNVAQQGRMDISAEQHTAFARAFVTDDVAEAQRLIVDNLAGARDAMARFLAAQDADSTGTGA